MKALCIDTSSDICSVCIIEDNKTIAIKELNNGKTHSENLMTLIDNILKENNIKLKELNVIACCVGPGSFTGIRIGLAAIKAIAETTGLPIISVTSLEGLAANENTENYICTMIDARNNQVYAGVFKNNNLLEEYMADDINNVLNNVKKYSDREILFIGNGAILHKEIILNKFSNKANFTEKNEQTSISIGKIANIKFKNEDFNNADTLLPLYLRKSQAERMKELNGSNN